MVSNLPTDGWSCETLGRGVTAAAAMAGLALQPEQLKEVLLGGNSGSHIYNSVNLTLPSKDRFNGSLIGIYPNLSPCSIKPDPLGIGDECCAGSDGPTEPSPLVARIWPSSSVQDQKRTHNMKIDLLRTGSNSQSFVI